MDLLRVPEFQFISRVKNEGFWDKGSMRGEGKRKSGAQNPAMKIKF